MDCFPRALIELVKCKMEVQMMKFPPVSNALPISGASGRISAWRPLSIFSSPSLDSGKQHTTTSHSSPHHTHKHLNLRATAALAQWPCLPHLPHPVQQQHIR